MAPATSKSPDETVILIPVPAAEPVVSAYRLRYDPSAGRGIPAHVTLLYPFLPSARLTGEVHSALRALVAEEPAFSFELTQVRTFGTEEGDALYLAPNRAAPFVRLTERIVARWPEAPPYGGAFASIVPHLTVAMLDDSVPAESLRRDLEPRLPIRARAEEAWLLARTESDEWREVGRFRLGSAIGTDRETSRP